MRVYRIFSWHRSRPEKYFDPFKHQILWEFLRFCPSASIPISWGKPPRQKFLMCVLRLNPYLLSFLLFEIYFYITFSGTQGISLRSKISKFLHFISFFNIFTSYGKSQMKFLQSKSLKLKPNHRTCVNQSQISKIRYGIERG